MIDGFQEYADLSKSNRPFLEGFRLDVLASNTHIVEFELGLVRANKKVQTKPTCSAQAEKQTLKRVRHLGPTRSCRMFRLVCKDVGQGRVVLDRQTMTICLWTEIYAQDVLGEDAIGADL